MSATMQNIADRLGVSLMTVSLALNGKGNLATATRKRIISTAQEMGYRRNAAARATATGRFDAVALLLDADLGRDHMPADLLYGIQQELEKRNMHLTIAHMSDQQLTSEEHLPKILSNVMADGLLINYKVRIPTELTELIDRHNIPAVWVESDRPADCVYHDNIAASRLATQHLIELGHRRIAFVDNHPTCLTIDSRKPYHVSLRDRRLSYQKTMEEAGLAPRLIDYDSSGLNTEDRIAQALHWLSEPAETRPTAVVSYVGATAMTIMWAAMQLNLRVPQDLSIITFVDGDAGSQIRPITRVQLNVREQGRTAIHMLLEKIDKPHQMLKTKTIEPKLVVDQSTARLH